MAKLKTITTTLLLISVAISLTGCATHDIGSSVLPQGGPSMADIYNQQYVDSAGANAGAGSNADQLDKVRAKLPPTDYQPVQATKARPIAKHTRHAKYTQYVKHNNPNGNHQGLTPNKQSMTSAPKMLPNPLIAIYVYPHFDGDNQDYVPGHMAYTKLYKQTHFALPGEPTAGG